MIKIQNNLEVEALVVEHMDVPAIPGYVQGMMRNAKPSGDYNRNENDRRERKSLPVVQGGSNLYYHLYITQPMMC